MSNCNRRRRVAHLKTVFAMIELATLAALATYLLDTTIRRRPITMAAVCLRTFRGAGIWLGRLAETRLSWNA